jgi:hypothetical protein
MIDLRCRHGKESGYCERCDAAVFDREDVEIARAEGVNIGAAVAFGLMGMADAIREATRPGRPKFCEHDVNLAYPCDGCGRGGGYDVLDEDPGECSLCEQPMELVRPGKSQPTCDCWEVDSDPWTADIGAIPDQEQE